MLIPGDALDLNSAANQIADEVRHACQDDVASDHWRGAFDAASDTVPRAPAAVTPANQVMQTSCSWHCTCDPASGMRSLQDSLQVTMDASLHPGQLWVRNRHVLPCKTMLVCSMLQIQHRQHMAQ